MEYIRKIWVDDAISSTHLEDIQSLLNPNIRAIQWSLQDCTDIRDRDDVAEPLLINLEMT